MTMPETSSIVGRLSDSWHVADSMQSPLRQKEHVAGMGFDFRVGAVFLGMEDEAIFALRIQDESSRSAIEGLPGPNSAEERAIFPM
jgi:hypothetical protein